MPQIQIHGLYSLDPKTKLNVLSGYFTLSWSGPDLKMQVNQYTIADAQLKFGSLLNGISLGTAGTPDRLFLNFDDNGNVVSVVAQVTSESSQGQTKLESNALASAQLSPQVISDATTAKADVEAKAVSADQAPIADKP